MTTLEIIFLIIIWLGYGLWAQHNTEYESDISNSMLRVVFVIFAPVVFVYRAIYGAFRHHNVY